MEYSHSIPPSDPAPQSANPLLQTEWSTLSPGDVPIVDHPAVGEGSAGYGGPVFKKTGSKIYIVAYPSDQTSTYFESDRSKPLVRSAGAGFAVFVEPKKTSKAKFWKQNGGEPTLFTVEGGGPAPGLTVRHGLNWGINGMLVRFLIDSREDVNKVDRVHQCLDNVARHARKGDELWLREALLGLIAAGLIRQFHVQPFIQLVQSVVEQQLDKGASWDHVVSIDYEDYISNTAECC